MKNKLLQAARLIQNYCAKSTCKECPFLDNTCMLKGSPFLWSIEYNVEEDEK